MRYRCVSVFVVGLHRYLAVSCVICCEIWFYNFITGEVKSVWRDDSNAGLEQFAPGPLCHGPDNTILSCNALIDSKSVGVFRITLNNELTLAREIGVDIDTPYGIACAETPHAHLVFTCRWRDKAICATHMQSGKAQWIVNWEVAGKLCEPHGLCYMSGRLYVADGNNRRVLVLEPATGRLLQSIPIPDMASVKSVAWSDTQPHLVIRHAVHGSNKHNVSYFDVK